MHTSPHIEVLAYPKCQSVTSDNQDDNRKNKKCKGLPVVETTESHKEGLQDGCTGRDHQFKRKKAAKESRRLKATMT